MREVNRFFYLRLCVVALVTALTLGATSAGCGMTTYYALDARRPNHRTTNFLAAMGVSVAAITAGVAADIFIVNGGNEDGEGAAPFTVIALTSEILVPVIAALASLHEDDDE